MTVCDHLQCYSFTDDLPPTSDGHIFFSAYSLGPSYAPNTDVLEAAG